MILLDTEDHVFLGHDYADLAALAAACLNCTTLDVMIVRTPE